MASLLLAWKSCCANYRFEYNLETPWRLVVVVFYWPLGSKQISRSIYIHITHTKHGKKLTSPHQSNKEINIASVSVDFVWYNRDFFTFQLLKISWNGQAPYSPSAPGNFLEPGQILGRPGLVALVPSQSIDTCVNTEMDNNNKALCWPTGAGSVSL